MGMFDGLLNLFSTKTKPGDPTAVCKFALIEVKVYFQKFPGTHGSDNRRGIHDVAYSYETAGVKDHGKTTTEGLVLMKIRTGETKIKLTIFATEYELTLVPTIDPVTTLKGFQTRLELLGYEPGPSDGVLDEDLDFATLEFQANNNPLDTTGETSPDAEKQLTAQAGV